MKLSLKSALAAVACAGLAATVASVAPASAGTPTAKPVATGDTVISSTGATYSVASLKATSAVHNGYAPKGLTARSDSTGGAHSNSIIGADNRVQITATTSFPNSAVVLIKRNGSLWCTGWMVGKDTLLTAGHCVSDGASHFYNGFTFTPGSNGGNAPFGTCGYRYLTTFTAWYSSSDSNYDMGIVKLNCSIGNSTGWFGTWWQTASLNGTFTRVQGYPGDKPSTQWAAYDSVRASSADRLYYQNDTIGGESGSPVWQYRGSSASYCTGACGMGVHTNGSNGTNNSGTRFTQGKLNVVYSVVNAA